MGNGEPAASRAYVISIQSQSDICRTQKSITWQCCIGNAVLAMLYILQSGTAGNAGLHHLQACPGQWHVPRVFLAMKEAYACLLYLQIGSLGLCMHSCLDALSTCVLTLCCSRSDSQSCQVGPPSRQVSEFCIAQSCKLQLGNEADKR